MTNKWRYEELMTPEGKTYMWVLYSHNNENIGTVQLKRNPTHIFEHGERSLLEYSLEGWVKTREGGSTRISDVWDIPNLESGFKVATAVRRKITQYHSPYKLGFQKGSALLTCENCGKKFRDVSGNSKTYCSKCFEQFEKENEEMDSSPAPGSPQASQEAYDFLRKGMGE